MAKLAVGVIGTGSIGNIHLTGYAQHPKDVKIQALCDITPSRLAEMGEKFGVAPEHRYADYRQMLLKEKLDAVSVCVPNLYHFECASAAIRHGINTLIEKPMVLKLEDAKKIEKLVAQTKVKVMVAFSHRFQRMNMEAKKLIAKGAIGDPYMIRVRYAHGGPYPGWAQSNWFYDPKVAGGGAMLDMGIHAIDICQYLVGPVRTVSAQLGTLRKKIKVDDNALMQLDFSPRKCFGYIEVGWTSNSGFVGIEVNGDKGWILLDLVNGPKITRGVMKPDGTRDMTCEEIKLPEGLNGWELQIASWIRYVQGKKTETGIPGVDEGIASLKVALAAMESHAKGRRVLVK